MDPVIKKKRTHYKICVFGDSVTYASYIKDSWFNQIRNYLESFDNLNIEIFNLGINGNCSTDILNRFEIEASSRKPNRIVFAFGVNDSAYILSTGEPITSENNFTLNIQTLIKKAKYLTTDITFIGPTLGDDTLLKPFPPSSKGKSFDKERVNTCNHILKELALEHECKFIETINQLNFDDFSDGLHPNQSGHNKLFELIKTSLE